MDNPEIDILLKIVIIGDSNVGKTQLLNRIVFDTFSEHSSPTLGIDFKKRDFTIAGKKVRLNFWDTAGQEKYKAINKSFFSQARGGILVFDITRESTLEALDNWYSDYKKYAWESAPFIIIGCFL